MTLAAYRVWFKGYEDQGRVINERSVGRAKAVHWRDVSDYAPSGLRFVDVRCRKLGPPQDTDDLRRVREYRGRPDLLAGARVRVQGSLVEGRVVDGASGCNFAILADTGYRFIAHSREIEVLRAEARS